MSHTVMRKQIQKFEVLFLSPAESQAPAPLRIVLLHGYGASSDDLAGLAQLAPLQGPVEWIFPQGPLEMNVGFGMKGYAWFPLDMEAFARAQAIEGSVDLSGFCPSEFLEVSQRVGRLIESFQQPHQKLIVGGFSQGAMLSTDVLWSHPLDVTQHWIMSGNLMARDRWQQLMKTKPSGALTLISHGEQDPVLGIEGSKKLQDLLNQNQVSTHSLFFNGGHEIPPRAIDFFGHWMSKVNLEPSP